jgi:fumarate reductase subunit D
MKRSNAPIYWLLFGAGGMLSALLGPALVFITGLAAPLGVLPTAPMGPCASALAFARHPIGKLALFAVVALFAWHAAHRLFHSLHDIGVRTGTVAWLSCYGSAAVLTLLLLISLLRIGF